MLSSCLLDIGDWALLIGRVVIAYAGLSVLWITARQLRRSRRPPVVPRVLWWFALPWAMTLSGIALYLLTTCNRLPNSAWTALYGASIGWVIIFLVWIIRVGIREFDRAESAAARLADSFKPVVDVIERQRTPPPEDI